MKILIYNRCGVLNDLIIELEKRGHKVFNHSNDSILDGWEEADVIIVWNDSEKDGWREWIKMVRKNGKKVILVQHGRKGVSGAHPPFNEKPIADLIFIWSKNDKKRLFECGIPEEKIIITGTPVLRHLKPRVKHNGKIVVFSPVHWDDDESENILVASKLRELKGVKIITKIIYKNFEEYYDNPVFSDISSPEHFEICADVLSKADLVVGLVDSTFELMAEILDIPVVVADIKIPEKQYHINLYPPSDACSVVKDISQLNNEIKKHLKHPELLREERSKIGIEAGGIDIENPVGEMIKVIEKI